MKFSAILFVAAAMSLSSCCTPPKENYQQSIQFDLGQAQVSFLTLKPVDSGDTVKARHLLMLPVWMNMDGARFYSVEGLTSLTPQERQDWTTLARHVLNYMLLHKDDWDLRLLDVQAGMRGLRYFLTTPEDVQRLNELSDYLAAAEKNKSEDKKP
jgi:hypothetical protein